MDTITFANGTTYRTHDALSSSAGSIGVANIRVLLAEYGNRVDGWSQIQLYAEAHGVATIERWAARVSGGEDRVVEPRHRLPTEDCLLVTDVLGSETVYLSTPYGGVIDALDDYPVIDDTVVAEVEKEWEREALKPAVTNR